MKICVVHIAAMVVYSVVIAVVFPYTVGYWGCLLGNKFLFFPLSLMAIFGVSVLSMSLARVPYVSTVLVWLSVVAEYALFAALAWALAGPLNFFVRFPYSHRRLMK